MNDPRPRWLGIGTIILMVLGLIILATRQSRTLGLRQTLQLDDFFFTVQDARWLPADPLQSRQPASSPDVVDYLVRFQIENRAKRVPFKFTGDSLAVADLDGKNHLIKPSGDRTHSGEMHPPQLHIIPAGESITINYVFSLPRDLVNLRLRIAPGGWSGELLEWFLFGRKEFQLP
jgi:hypothetical protein